MTCIHCGVTKNIFMALILCALPTYPSPSNPWQLLTFLIVFIILPFPEADSFLSTISFI